MRKFEYALLSIFYLSGMAGLVYQVSWQRLLTLYYGVGHVSTTIIVSVFMLGLGLGALVGGAFIDKAGNRLKMYFTIELLIALFGYLSIGILNLIASSTSGASYLVTFLCIFAFLCVPTFLMGTTLPVLTRILFDQKPTFLRNLTKLYFINTLGAATGALVAAYALISFFGIDTAIYVAATVNAVLAGWIYLLFRHHETTEHNAPAQVDRSASESVSKAHAFSLVFVTGFVAIGYEIVWFRIFSVITKSSPYSFASTLFVYLVGIAFGSYLMSVIIAKGRQIRLRRTFYLLQVTIAVFVVLSVSLFYYAVEFTSVSGLVKASFDFNPHPKAEALTLASISKDGALPESLNAIRGLLGDDLFLFLGSVFINIDVFFWPVLFILVPTLAMGASFPLMASLAKREPQQEGSIIGDVYFYNVLGNVAGGLVTGFILLPLLNTTGTLLLFAMVGMLFLFGLNPVSGVVSRQLQALGVVLFAVSSVLVMPSNSAFYSAIHFLPPDNHQVEIDEGDDVLVVSSFREPDRLSMLLSGLQHGGRPNPSFMSIPIEAAAHLQAEGIDVLVIGFGTGSIVEALLRMEDVNSVICVEISRTVIDNLMKFDDTRRILEDEKLTMVIDDGRRYLYRTQQQFDLVVMDPLRTSTAYSNNIYSQEFFALLNDHLSKRGVLAMYNDYEYDILTGTLLQVFDNVKVYPAFVVASDEELVRQPETYDAILRRFDPDVADRIRKARSEVLFDERGFEGSGRINTDLQPRLEYYLWKAFE